MEKLKFAFYRYLQVAILLASTIVVNSQETVVIRTDRDLYISGEPIWIYANCIESQSNNTSLLSKIVYIELLDKQNIPVQQIKCRVQNGQARIQLRLPDTLSTGNYLLRGYTKWMQNFDVEYFARKKISIVNPFVKNSMPAGENLFKSDTVIIYPEGGKILAGTENKLLIRGLSSRGSNIQLKGAIVSDASDTINLIETNKNGYAVTSFRPEIQKKYSFVYKSENKAFAIKIQGIKESGYNLRLVDQDENRVILKVYSANPNKDPKLFVNLIRTDGSFISKHVINEQNEVVIQKSGNNPEIVVAILVDEKDKMLSERPLKLNSSMPANETISLLLNKTEFKTRERVELVLKNNASSAGLKNISVSVFRKCLVNDCFPIQSINISDDRLNEIIGQLVDSLIGFNDLLLTSHSLHQKSDNQNNKLFLPEPKGEIISGKLLDKKTNLPIKNKKLLLNVVGKLPTFDIAETDAFGNFNFELAQYGKKEIVIQPYGDDSIKNNFRINLDPSFSESYDKQTVGKLTMSLEKAKEINEIIVNMQLNSVYRLYNQNHELTDSVSDIKSFYDKAEISVNIGRFIELSSVAEIVKELLPFTFLATHKGETVFKVIENTSMYPSEGDTKCFVDGVLINDAGRILQIAPNEIEKVDIINLNYFMGDISLGRLLFFYTISGNLKAMDFDKNIFRQAWQFNAPDYTFIGPDYSLEGKKDNRIPDFRNLLYFNTLESLSRSGQTFTFYTGDDAAQYTILVEGIRPDGSLARIESDLEVVD